MQGATPAEYLLAEQVDLHSGAPVPFWMFARLANREHQAALWVHGFDRLAARARRYLIAVVGFALVNLGSITVYFVHRLQAQAIAEERASVLERQTREWRDNLERQMREWRGDMQREIDGLRMDVYQLRREVHRISGSDVPDSSVPSDPDKLSLLSDPAWLGRLVIRPWGPTVDACASF